MFNNQRYLTRGVQSEILLKLQIFMWECIDALPPDCDYFQVFELENLGGLQKIHHFSEQPEYSMQYFIPVIKNAVTAKIYVVDDGDYSTMLLAEEY